MRLPTRTWQRGLRFNITPLIDIIFLLIIFFLAATHFVRSERHETVDLPEATWKDNEIGEAPRQLIVTISGDRQMHVGGKIAQLPQIEQMILVGVQAENSKPNNFEVRIRGDKSVPYKLIEPIMLACARNGVSDLKFAVILK